MIQQGLLYSLVAVSQREGYAFIRSIPEPDVMWLISRERGGKEPVSGAELGIMMESDSSLRLLPEPERISSIDQYRDDLIRASDSCWIFDTLNDLHTLSSLLSSRTSTELLDAVETMVAHKSDAAEAFSAHVATLLQKGHTSVVATLLDSARRSASRHLLTVSGQTLQNLLNRGVLPHDTAAAVRQLQSGLFSGEGHPAPVPGKALIPLISVVIPCYNEAPALETYFEAIRHNLGQLEERYELIFVDDASRDNSASIISALIDRNPNVQIQQIVHSRNQGFVAALKHGFQAARGEIIGHLEVDSPLEKDAISSLIQAIREGADIAAARTAAHSIIVGAAFLVGEPVPMFFRRGKCLPWLDEVHSGWFWNREIMSRALDRGLRIVEVPIILHRRRRVKIMQVRALFRDLAGSIAQLVTVGHIRAK